MSVDLATDTALVAAYAEIERLGLEANVAELDAYGFTVVDPERVAPEAFADQLRGLVLAVAERRTGVRPDDVTGATHACLTQPTGEHLFYLLFEDPAFEQAVLNPVVLALVTYLLGASCLLSSVTSIIKGPGTPALPLHSDNVGVPPPFPPYAQVANATWLLSDYSAANGALCFVPGSHRLCRHPTPAELFPERNPAAVPVEAPKGSLVVWHGNTWHGAFTRTAPGLRINLILYFCRQYLQTQERYRDDVTPEILARNPPRLATLMGQDTTYGWRADGPDRSKLRVLVHDPHT